MNYIRQITIMTTICHILLLLMMPFQTRASAKDIRAKVSINYQRVPAASLISELGKQTGINFIFDLDQIKTIELKNIHYQNKELGIVLNDLNANSTLIFDLINSNSIAVSVRKKKSMSAPKLQEPGRIAGRVVDDKGEPLPGASIKLIELNKVLSSSVDGTYQFSVPSGNYTIEVSYISFQTKRIADVVVKDGELVKLDVVLNISSNALNEVVVQSTYKKESVAGLYTKQKNNASITDGISAEQIRLTPDNNTAQVLKRVSGLTVQDEKFVVVRGLSERYNNVQLNGSNLPSTEPNRKNFAFDIIPSSLVSNIVVNKTATPDQTAEFSGALVQVNTIDVPEEDFLSFSVGSGVNSNIKGRDIISTKRGNKDYLGYADSRRTWLGNAFDRNEYARLYNAGIANTANYATKVPNNWGLYNYKYVPVQSYQLGAGKAIRLKNNASLGFVAGGTYRNEQTIEDFDRLNPGYYYVSNGQNYAFNTAWAAIANTTYQDTRSKLSFKNTMTRRFSNESGLYSGYDIDATKNTNDYYDILLINHLYSTRLEGDHTFIQNNSWKIDWFGDYSLLKREQPDTRFARSISGASQPLDYSNYNLSDGASFSSGASLYGSELTEKRYNAGASLSKKIMIGKREQLIKGGYAYTQRKADFESAGYRIKTNVNTPGATEKFHQYVEGKPDYLAFDPANFENGTLYYFPSGATAALLNNAGEEYYGIQKLHAAYLMLDIKPIEKLRLIGGVRMEKNNTVVNGAFYDQGSPAVRSFEFKETSFLPSFNGIYSLNQQMNVRLAYSKTLGRPDFRERQNFKYYDFKEMVYFFGARGLKDVKTNNLDLRYEWYPGVGEVISVTGFYKHFANPVETVGFANSGGGYSFIYFNLDESKNQGIEVDFRKSLRFIGGGSGFFNNLYLNGNFTWMHSEVTYDKGKLYYEIQQLTPPEGEIGKDTRKRALQGLSPYVMNGGIAYTGKRIGFALSYNKSGRRIRFAGGAPGEDQYETPRDVLDMQVSARFLKQKMELKFNVSDLLNQRFVVYQNRKYEDDKGGTFGDAESEKDLSYNKGKDLEWYGYKRGTNSSFSISYRF